MSHPSTLRDPYFIGKHEARALAGDTMIKSLDNLLGSDDSLYRNLVRVGFGSSVALSGVEYREYAMRALAILSAIGDTGDQAEIYVDAALSHGATEAEILSVIDQTSQYAGFPKAVNALRRIGPQLQKARKIQTLTVKESIAKLSDHETLIRDTGGSGVPMLLIHALCMDGLMFQKLVPELAAGIPCLRVISYDLRGHGHARGAPLTESLEQLADDLYLLLNKMQIEKVDLVGSSYGGSVAEEFAIRYPHRVRALCPMATGGTGNPTLLSRATRALAGEMPALRTESMIRWFLPESIADNTWCVRYARNKLDHVTIAEWAAAWTAMSRLDALLRLRSLDCPVLVLCGAKDLSATPDQMRPIHQTFVDVGKGNSVYIEIPNGTHMMPMEQYVETAEALMAWRKKIDAPSEQTILFK